MLTEKLKTTFGAVGEWISIVGPIFGLFLYVHHENVHLNDRLDLHMHEIHKRSDELHKEFYELLKERRKSGD